jgi:hypothetical protein
MTRKYRFASIFWNIVGLAAFLVFSYDLACRFCTALDASWCAYIRCPSGGTIWSNTSYWYSLVMDIIIVFLSAGLIFLHKCIVLDSAKRKIFMWHHFLWFALFQDDIAVSPNSKVKLTRKRLSTGWNLVKGSSVYIKAIYYVIDIMGHLRAEVMRFRLRFRARRLGRDMADFLHIPFIDTTATGTVVEAEEKEDEKCEEDGDKEDKEKVVTRREAEEVIKRWQDGQISNDELVQWSLDRHPDEGYRYTDVDWPEWEEGKAGSAINEVMICIEDMDAETPVRDLAPAMLAFLQSDPRDFERAEEEFRSALKKIGWGK